MAEVAKHYQAVYPTSDRVADAELQNFIANFYRLTDSLEGVDEWPELFTKDTNVQIGELKAQGREGVRELRRGIRGMLRGSEHRVLKVFPGQFAGSQLEFMVYGEATHFPRDKEPVESTYSAHMALSKEGEEGWKVSDYRVWIQFAAGNSLFP